MEKILAGDYTYGEFNRMVKEWRERYAVNGLAVYPSIKDLGYIENKRIVFLPDKVRLEEIV